MHDLSEISTEVAQLKGNMDKMLKTHEKLN